MTAKIVLIVGLGILAYGIAEGLNSYQGIAQQSARDHHKNLQAKYDSWGVYKPAVR